MLRMDEKRSSRAFWDAVEQRLTACSQEELRAIVRALAQATLPEARAAFLDILYPLPTTAMAMLPASTPDTLLGDIVALVDALQTAVQGEDDWDEYSDEDSPGPYAAFVEPLTTLFARVGAVFEAGNMALVRTAYHRLLTALELGDGDGHGRPAAHLHAVNLPDVRARYLRAVYATATPAQRSAELCHAMREVRSWVAGPCPMLSDIIRISAQPLPDWEQFCHGWIAFLRTQSGHDADAWLREAVRLAQGTAGLEALARGEGLQHPRAYLDWCGVLEAEGNYHAMLTAAQEALRTLPAQLPIRAAIADYLCTAATHLHDTATLRSGRWEAFVARPALARLLDVWEVMPASAARTRRMQQAAEHVQHVLAHLPEQAERVLQPWEDTLESPTRPARAVLAHAYLLAGNWDAARQLVAPEQVLGWSSSHNPQGLIVAFFLVQMSGMAPDTLSPNLMQLWHWELQNSTGFVSWHSADAGEASLLTRLQRLYIEYLPAVSFPSATRADMLAWCLDVAQRRVAAIVSNQHRGSYDKAALLLAACVELLRCLGQASAGAVLLDEARQRFRRHRAFQTELQAAVRRMGA